LLNKWQYNCGDDDDVFLAKDYEESISNRCELLMLKRESGMTTLNIVDFTIPNGTAYGIDLFNQV